MTFRIQQAVPTDLPYVIELMRDFAEFEKLSHTFTVTDGKLYDAIFGPKAFAECFTAFYEKRMVGFAIVFPVLHTFRGERSLFLEDLYVCPEMRGKGLGLKLLREIAIHAKASGYDRMDWQALDWNEAAINFYKKIGADADDGLICFSLRGEEFERFIG